MTGSWPIVAPRAKDVVRADLDLLTDRERERLTTMRQREDAAFGARVPKSLALGSKARGAMPNGVPMAWMAGLYRTPPVWISSGRGATFTGVDGNSYVDFTICDMSAVLGYANPRLSEVIGEQAALGVQVFLPVEAALAVCEQLRLRFGLAKWQFTLSATTADIEAIRLARVATGREGVLLFGGKITVTSTRHCGVLRVRASWRRPWAWERCRRITLHSSTSTTSILLCG